MSYILSLAKFENLDKNRLVIMGTNLLTHKCRTGLRNSSIQSSDDIPMSISRLWFDSVLRFWLVTPLASSSEYGDSKSSRWQFSHVRPTQILGVIHQHWLELGHFLFFLFSFFFWWRKVEDWFLFKYKTYSYEFVAGTTSCLSISTLSFLLSNVTPIFTGPNK